MALGYLGLLTTTTGASTQYMGGVLISDDFGLPVDFQYTEPITPSRIQQALYGQGLGDYIKTRVLWPALLDACADHQLTYVYTQDTLMLQAPFNPHTSLVSLRETHLDPLADDPCQVTGPTECLLQLVKAGPPLKVEWQTGMAVDPLLQHLQTVSQQLILLEPFNRVQAALRLLAQELSLVAA
jgi:hypothetical protein